MKNTTYTERLGATSASGMPVDRSDTGPLSAEVDRLFAEWDNCDSPGAALSIIKDGSIIYKRGYGCANLEYDIAITPSTIFDIASVSKQFTGMAIAMLVHDRKIALDDDIHKYLPEVPDFGKIITIRHLVHHISGLRDWVATLVIAGWQMDDVITFEQILKMVRHQKELNFEPGEEYLYSNTGYNLLAEIVARVSSLSFREWTEAKIFKPLGMTNTHFHDDYQMVVKNRAYSYEADDGGGFKNLTSNLTALGSSSLYATVEDLAKWIQNFDDGRVGGTAVIDQMHNPGVLNNGKEISYAFGVDIGKYKGLKTVRHSGSWAGFRSYLVRFPDQKFAVVILSNLSSVNPSSLAMQVADIYLADQLVVPKDKPKSKSAERKSAKIELAPLTPDQLAEFVGDYYSDELGTIYTMVVKDDHLVAQHRRHDDIPLTLISADHFTGEAWWFHQVHFTRDDEKRVTGFRLTSGRVRNLRFDKRALGGQQCLH